MSHAATSGGQQVELRHGRMRLALRRLDDGGRDGRALLLLHGLGLATPEHLPDWAAGWPGPVWGLDFTGHGDSTLPRGGGYSAEMLVCDADAALEHLGEATIVGEGLGGYIGLLLAGARAARVHGVVVCDGPGLAGGGTQPGTPVLAAPAIVPDPPRTPDPFALVELSRDVRPPDYVLNYVRFAFEGSPVSEPVTVAAVVRPEWLAAVAAEPGVVSASRERALAGYQVGS